MFRLFRAILRLNITEYIYTYIYIYIYIYILRYRKRRYLVYINLHVRFTNKKLLRYSNIYKPSYVQPEDGSKKPKHVAGSC
jgi:hypothetical protein